MPKDFQIKLSLVLGLALLLCLKPLVTLSDATGVLYSVSGGEVIAPTDFFLNHL